MVTFLSCDTQQMNTKIKIKPFIQTDDSRCGPATLHMILDYYGITVTEDELAVLCNHSYQIGCTNSDMERVLKQYGLITLSKQNSSIKNWWKRLLSVLLNCINRKMTLKQCKMLRSMQNECASA